MLDEPCRWQLDTTVASVQTYLASGSPLHAQGAGRCAIPISRAAECVGCPRFARRCSALPLSGRVPRDSRRTAVSAGASNLDVTTPTTSLFEAAAQTAWSAANREFLAFARDNVVAQRLDAYAQVVADLPPGYALQPWPFFVGSGARDALAAAATGLDRLVREVPMRFFGCDAQRLARYYRTNNAAVLAAGARVFPREYATEELLELLLEPPHDLEAAPSRGDYVHTAEGLKCVELNVGGLIGGLPAQAFANRFAAAAPIAHYLSQSGRTLRPQRTVHALFDHLLEEAGRLGVWNSGSDFHLVILVPEALRLPTLRTYYEHALRDALALRGSGAAWVTFCEPSQLTQGADGLLVGDRPVHGVLDQHTAGADLRLPFRWYKRGRLILFSSPLAQLLTDKRNLALLSSRADSDDLTSAERDLVATHVPWTRRLEHGLVRFRGRTLRIPGDLAAVRKFLVLKKATSLAGQHVHFGAECAPAEWDHLIQRGLKELDWIVQEHLTPERYVFQSGAEGIAPFDAVLGLFVFGGRFGGVYVRTQPVAGGASIVNRERGAQVAVVFESPD